MSASRALRSVIKNLPDSAQAALTRAKNLYKNVRRVPSRLAPSSVNDMASGIKNSPDPAKSIDDAIDVDTALGGSPTSHPLGKVGDVPVTSTKGDAPPPKDATNEMPSGPVKVETRWQKVSKYVGGSTILAGVGVGTWLAVSGVNLQNTDSVEVKITKIEKIKDEPKKYKFTYQTQGGQMCGTPPIACIQNAFKPCKNDTFTFRSTHTTPTLNDVTALVIDVDDKAVYFELDLTNMGDGTPEWGFMTCHSSFENQFRASIKDAIQLIVDIADDIATPVFGGFCDAIPIPFICTGFDFTNWTVWVCIICLCMCCIGLLVLGFS
jgi:hypothetical protein